MIQEIIISAEDVASHNLKQQILELQEKIYSLDRLLLWGDVPAELQVRANAIVKAVENKMEVLQSQLSALNITKQIALLEKLEQEFIK